jgi:hypothetical protein
MGGFGEEEGFDFAAGGVFAAESGGDTGGEDESKEESKEDKPEQDPANFSQLDFRKGPINRAAFPLFAHAVGVECEVRAGEMLFLPASWFHEVGAVL